MKSGDKRYIWQRDDWPHWVYDYKRLTQLLAQVHMAQGLLLGRMLGFGIDLRGQRSHLRAHTPFPQPARR